MIKNRDAEEIVGLMFKSSSSDDCYKKSKELNEVEDPPALVDYILDEFFILQESSRSLPNNSGPYYVLQFVEDNSNPTHRERICQMLSWDEILPHGPTYSRSCHITILSALGKVGDKSCVPAIEALGERLQAVRYENRHNYDLEKSSKEAIRMSPDGLRKDDARIVARAIAACQERG